MTRWTQRLEELKIKEKIDQAFDLIKDRSAFDPSNLQEVEELSRLKKVIKFIKETFDSGDPELIPLNIMDQANNTMSSVLSYIKSYTVNNTIDNIINANNQIDIFLSQLKPYHPMTRGVAQAAGKAFKDYANNIKSSLDEIKNMLPEIIDLHNNIFSKNGIKDNIESLKENSENIFENLNGYHAKVFGNKDNDEDIGISGDIENAYNEIKNKKEDIDNYTKESRRNYNEISSYFEEIFGYDKTIEDENGEKKAEHIPGKSEEFSNLIGKMKSFEEEQKEKYKHLLDEINSLLPGATSAGLATAFRSNKASFRWKLLLNSFGFFASIVALTVIGITFIYDFSSGNMYGLEFKNFEETIHRLLTRMAIALPIIWLAMVFSKRRNQAERLQQEYAHKEAIASSYESFRRQIEELQRDREELLVKLMSAAIDAVAYNAASTLDKQHVDTPPLIKAVENIPNDTVKKMVDAIPKVIKKAIKEEKS